MLSQSDRQSFERSHQFDEKTKIDLKLLEKSEELYIIQLFAIKEGHFRVLLVPNESKKLNVWISQTDKLEQQQIDSEMRSNITTNSKPSVKDEVQVFDRLHR